MSNNILSLQDFYEFKVENKYLIRLHEHGLLRLITLNTDPKFSKVTKKIFFHSLLNNQVYQELFFDHYTQKSAGKHGPFLTKNLAEKDFMEISEKYFKKDVIQIVSSPKWSCPPVSKESLTKVKYLLNKFVNDQGKIIPRRVTGTSMKMHRKLVTAIKRARNVALLPFAAIDRD